MASLSSSRLAAAAADHAAPETTAPKLLTVHDVCRRIGFRQSKIYLLIRDAGFPKPIKVGASSRWVTSEVDAWIDEQIANAHR